jgi:hypothetical protein
LTPIQTRVPDDVIERLDALIPFVSTDPALRATGRRIQRADVVRVALELGARALEERKAAGLPPVEALAKP